jgi:hypothetical protein
MGTCYGGRRACSVQSGRRSRPARARSARTSAKRESTGIEQGAATAAIAKFECGERAARISHVTWSKQKKLRILRQTQVLERVIRRRQICVQPPTDTGSSILYCVLLYSHFINRYIMTHPRSQYCDNHVTYVYPPH